MSTSVYLDNATSLLPTRQAAKLDLIDVVPRDVQSLDMAPSWAAPEEAETWVRYRKRNSGCVVCRTMLADQQDAEKG